MSHIDVGPLAGYNSLTDQHLAGYFNNTRMRKHLVKSGLITRQGEVIPESVFRLNSSRRDHRRNVRDLLAQAIVHKTLDYERTRQVAIRRKLEEIAKIEMVRRVRAERHRKGDEDLVPLMSPRVRRPRRTPNRIRDTGEDSVSDSMEQKQSVDPIYVDSHGMPVSPDAESRARLLRKFPDEEIDSKHLYALDSVALREYAKVLERYERGRVARSPYMLNQLPRPPTSAGSSRRAGATGATGGRGTKSAGTKTKGNLVMHRPEPAVMQQSRFQSLCEVEMRYYGQNLGGAAARDDMDPAQEVLVEQQHCGGNTLIVFKRSILPGTNFSFYSRRHRGYPFSLTVYINGVKDSRLSTCCEYRHRNGSRLGGKQGHFGFVKVKGAAPCYKCQVERGMIPVPPSKSGKKKKASTEDEYKEDFEEDQEKDETSDHSDEEEKGSARSSKSSKTGSAHSSPRSASEEEEKEAGSHRSSDSSKHEDEEKNDDAKELDKEDGEEVHPIGFGDADDEKKDETKEDDDKASSRSSSSSASSGSSGSSSSLKKKKKKREDEEAKKEDEVVVESDSEVQAKETTLSPQESVEVPVEEEEAQKAASTEAQTVAISIFTGDELGAGTNSHVFCRLIGSEGTSEVLTLGGSDAVDRFERGSVDSFRLSMTGFKGEPRQLEIWHDGHGIGATWLLDKATVIISGVEYEFLWRNWVEGERGDSDHHQFIDVTRSHDDEVAKEEAEAPVIAAKGEEEPVDDKKSSSSAEESSSEDEEFEVKAAAPENEDSSSPSSSSDEEEKEDQTSGVAPTSDSGPDGGNDPDASRNLERRPLLSDAVDDVAPFFGNVRDFVKAPENGESGYSVEVINTALTAAQFRELGEAMAEVPIECLNIRNGRIDDEKLEILVEVLEQKSDLKLLNLNCNLIGASGARLIADRIGRWSKLEMILLHGNPLLDDGTEAIVSAIIQCHMSSNRIEALHLLDLGDSEMTNQGAYVVSQLLGRNTPLDCLELTGNRKIGLDGWRQIGQALAKNTQLRTLSVDYCGLEDNQLQQLIAHLPYNATLQSLDLEGNEVTDVGGKYLRDMLVENDCLTDISLRPGNTLLSDDLAEEIKEMARNNADD